MKFLINGTTAVNLANVSSFTISNNYLILTITDGREMRFVYGTDVQLVRLFHAITAFLESDKVCLGCSSYLSD